MKKAFSTRKVPRRVGADEDVPSKSNADGSVSSGISNRPTKFRATCSLTRVHSPRRSLTDHVIESTLRRPSSKPRKSSSLRTSFGPSTVEDQEADESGGVITPKRSNLSRITIQRNASKRTSLLASSLPARDPHDDDDRPSYSASSLQELKDSTPSTPRDLGTSEISNPDVDDAASRTQALDLSSKFGASLARYQQQSPSSAIPSGAEIAEKKARRARLAREQAADEYISLDPDDPNLDNDDDGDDNVTRDEHGRLILKPKEDKYGMSESRLVREDEDIMENFDEFTEDGKIHLGRKAEAEAAKRRKQEMAAQIAEAEGLHADDNDEVDSDSNASEKERNAAFEAAQTRHGTYGASHTTSSKDTYADMRPKTPPIISPIPTLDSVLERLRKQVADMQSSRLRKLQEMEALQREKVRLGEEEVRIQRALRETAEKFRELRREKGIAVEELGNGGPAVVAFEAGGEDEADGMDAELAGANGEGESNALGGEHTGLGFAGLGARGLGSTPGMGVPQGEGGDDEW